MDPDPGDQLIRDPPDPDPQHCPYLDNFPRPSWRWCSSLQRGVKSGKTSFTSKSYWYCILPSFLDRFFLSLFEGYLDILIYLFLVGEVGFFTILPGIPKDFVFFWFHSFILSWVILTRYVQSEWEQNRVLISITNLFEISFKHNILWLKGDGWLSYGDGWLSW